jgi:multisubunit Na+/H+ antiporter MnhG subunit
MSAVAVVQAALVGVAVTVQLASVLGVLVARGTYERLHFLGPASVVAPLPIAVAVALEGNTDQVGVKAILVALALLITNPVIVHTTARAVRIRDEGGWRVLPDEAKDAEQP